MCNSECSPSSSSQASANSSARFPRPFPGSTAELKPLEDPKSPLRLWDDIGRGVEGDCMELREDFRLCGYRVEEKMFDWGLMGEKFVSIPEDLRRRFGVRGDVIGYRPVVQLEIVYHRAGHGCCRTRT